jgi:hypothetical protein
MLRAKTPKTRELTKEERGREAFSVVNSSERTISGVRQNARG